MRPSAASLSIAVSVLVILPLHARAVPATIGGGESKVYLRNGPGPDYKPVGVVAAGQPLDAEERTGTWIRVALPDGTSGWVYAGYVVLATGAAVPTSAPRPAGTPMAPATGLVPMAPTAPARAGAGQTPAVRPTAAGATAAALVVPTAAPAPAASGDGVSNDIADLRAEVDDLKRRVAEQTRTGEPSVEPPVVAIPTVGGAEARPAQETPVATVVVALVSLLVGWLAGFGVGRRRTRNQKARLRF